MKQRLKTCLDNIKRLYNIIFENRELTTIQDDYHLNKWISKSELEKLFEFEKMQLLQAYKEKEQEFQDLMRSFNMNSLSNYEALERKYQGSLKKKQ